MRRIVVAITALCLVVPAGAIAARTLSYQGYTSQGFQIKFKRSAKGVFRIIATVRANCQNSNGQNQGDYDFSYIEPGSATPDPIRGGRMTTTILTGSRAPELTIAGSVNSHGTARGTMTASGHGKGPNGEDLGTCKSRTVRWTAAP